MSVTGTPVTSETVEETSCETLSTVSPVVTNLYEKPLVTKRRATAIAQGQVATVSLQLFNIDGNPVDVTTCGIDDDDATATAKIREVISTSSSDIYSISGTITDETTGIVSVEIPDGVYNTAGVYNLELGILSADSGNLVFTNKFYLWVDRGLFGDSAFPNAGPPTIDEIRLFVRDNAPEENLLLDELEFDLAEFCQAAELAVRYWNESQPPIDLTFNTCSFPVHMRWLNAIAGNVMIMAAHRFRRNQLAYQSAGLSVDDQNKFQQYEMTGLRLQQEFKEWVKAKKVQINCEAAISGAGSSYGLTYLTTG